MTDEQPIITIVADDDAVGVRLRELVAPMMPEARFDDDMERPDHAPLIGVAMGRDIDRLFDRFRAKGRGPSHLVILHPQGFTAELALPSLEGIPVLMTAGASDPNAPADMVGELADALEAAGAKLKLWWHAGGPEVTDAEMAMLRDWFNDLRAHLEGPDALIIRREDDGARGRWYLLTAGGIEAEMTYRRVGTAKIIIDHTEVPDVFKGMGVGKRLFDHMVAVARAEQLKVVPLCPFAAAMFARNPDDTDVLDTTIRVRPG